MKNLLYILVFCVSLNTYANPSAYKALGLSDEAISKLEQTDFTLLSNSLGAYVHSREKGHDPINEQLLRAIYLKAPLGKYGYNTLYHIYFAASLREENPEKAFETFRHHLLTLKAQLVRSNESLTEFHEAGQSFVIEQSADRKWKEEREELRSDLIAYATSFSLPAQILDILNTRKIIETSIDNATPRGHKYFYQGMKDSEILKRFDTSSPSNIQWFIDQFFKPNRDQMVLNLEPYYRPSLLKELYFKTKEDLRGLEDILPKLLERIDHANILVRKRALEFLQLLIADFEKATGETKSQLADFLTGGQIIETLPQAYTKRDTTEAERGRVKIILTKLKDISQKRAEAEANLQMQQILSDSREQAENKRQAEKQTTDWFKCNGYLKPNEG